jgi:hypothetical protein
MPWRGLRTTYLAMTAPRHVKENEHGSLLEAFLKSVISDLHSPGSDERREKAYKKGLADPPHCLFLIRLNFDRFCGKY